jgi:hypothetical protein
MVAVTRTPHASVLVSGLAGVVVGALAAGGVAYAANGGAFVVGKANKETVVSTLPNPLGTPLSLVAEAGKPAPKVSNAVKVPLLNSDKLDNRDSTAFVRVGATVANATTAANANALAGKPETAFALAAAQSGYVESTTTLPYDDPSTPQNPDAVYATATCPAGTVLTGGGGAATGEDDLFFSGPAGVLTWEADALTGPVWAYAICLSRRGPVPSGVTAMSAGPGSADRATSKQSPVRTTRPGASRDRAAADPSL